MSLASRRRNCGRCNDKTKKRTKNITGFISSIRLKEACRILRQEPGIRINELSYRVGFSTPRYFSQCFKKEFGMVVKEYVEQLKK